MNSDRRAPLTRGQAWAIWWGFWLLMALVAWLDAGAGVHAQHADVFSAIWVAIQAVGGFLSTVGGAIATSLEGVVAYLVTAVSWLAGRVASILVSTGSMFAKVWDGVKVVWNDVLKPALVWVDQQLARLHAWLKDTFGPVFDFLGRVRDELLAVYKHFVQPIVDTIEWIRQLNRVLLAFHIDVLKGLDSTLQSIEQRIEEPILWINQKLNEIWNALEKVITLDGLFQRLTLIRSMGRYAPQWMRMAVNNRTKPLTGGQAYAITRANETQSVPQITDDLRTYLTGGDVNIGEVIDQATERSRAYYNAA